MDTSIQLGMPSIRFDPLNFDIPNARYMNLGSDLGQDISTLWGIWCILRSQLKNMFLMDSSSMLQSHLKNRSQVHKLSDLLMPLDTLNQLGKLCKKLNQFINLNFGTYQYCKLSEVNRLLGNSIHRYNLSMN